VPEQLAVLKGAGDPEAGNAARGETGDVAAA